MLNPLSSFWTKKDHFRSLELQHTTEITTSPGIPMPPWFGTNFHRDPWSMIRDVLNPSFFLTLKDTAGNVVERVTDHHSTTHSCRFDTKQASYLGDSSQSWIQFEFKLDSFNVSINQRPLIMLQYPLPSTYAHTLNGYSMDIGRLGSAILLLQCWMVGSLSIRLPIVVCWTRRRLGCHQDRSRT